MTGNSRIGVILNGVTGRMGSNQHLLRSLAAIREAGGVAVPGGPPLLPEPVLVGRDPARLQALAARAGGLPWTTDLAACLADRKLEIYFDAQTTERRFAAVAAAIRAGKHVYCEKPAAATTAQALELHRLAEAAGVRHGVVQDKLFLPGIRRLAGLQAEGFFGELLSVHGEFGYWVFDGENAPAQRPSWNYRREAGGGIILDMFCHWRYLLDRLFGGVKALSCLGATHVGRRRDEQGRPYECTADDAAYATFELAGGAVAQINASWATRVRRDDLFTLLVNGTGGSALAGLSRCWIQPLAATPRPVWNPDEESPHDYRGDWLPVPDREPRVNAFRAQWERFLRHAALGEPFPWNLLEGARGVQLAELALESWRRRAWVEVPPLG